MFPRFSSRGRFFALALRPGGGGAVGGVFGVGGRREVLTLISVLMFTDLGAILVRSCPTDFFGTNGLKF